MPTSNFGIDLGTTYSAISFINEMGQAEIIDHGGTSLVPSIVYLGSDGIVVGDAAREKGKDGGVIQFICDYHKEKLQAEYLGGSKNYSFQITANDKNAVAQTNELAIILSDIDRLKKEIQKAQGRIEYLKTKTTSLTK